MENKVQLIYNDGIVVNGDSTIEFNKETNLEPLPPLIVNFRDGTGWHKIKLDDDVNDAAD